MTNTFSTTLGYLGTRVRQRLGLEGPADKLEDIFNYLQLDERTATSGQPTQEQFRLIQAKGYTTVINLAPKNHENALGNEDEVLADLGVRYFHHPVVFTDPKRADFDGFVALFEAL